MKKLLLSAALIASALTTFAQTPSVPNGDFEGWVTGVSCSSQPSQYITASDMFFSTASFCPTTTGITKSTTTYSGSSALQLSALTFNSANISNIAFLGTSVSSQGVAFTGRPTKLIGYTKFTKGGADTLGIFIELDDASGNEVAYGEVSISTTQSGYTRFEITLDYDATNTNAVAQLIIGFGLGDANDDISSTTVALIDALTFDYTTTPTATVNYTANSPINVFAASKTINFSENVSEVYVVDMVGAQKISESGTTKTLNAASLNTGMYIVTYKYNDAYFSKKVVIE